MEKEKGTSLRIVLTETLIVIGIFAVISVFLVQMFTQTSRIRQKAVDTSKAMIAAQNVAEQLKNSVSVAEAANRLSMTACDTAGTIYCIYYDKEWKTTNEPSAHIVIVTSTVIKGDNGRVVSADVNAYKSDSVESTREEEPLISLNVKKYVTDNK